MKSIVNELQKELLDKNSNMSNCLNKAYLIARKLHIPDFETFVEKEINGYTEKDEVPDYRIVRGILNAQNPVVGWQPIQNIPPELEIKLAVEKLRQPLTELETAVLSNHNNNTMFLPADSSAGMRLLGSPIPVGLFVTVYQIHSIVEKVRHTLLKWAVDLEENGILGENLSFSSNDQQVAQATPGISSVTITAQTGATVNIASTDNSINN